MNIRDSFYGKIKFFAVDSKRKERKKLCERAVRTAVNTFYNCPDRHLSYLFQEGIVYMFVQALELFISV